MYKTVFGSIRRKFLFNANKFNRRKVNVEQDNDSCVHFFNFLFFDCIDKSSNGLIYDFDNVLFHYFVNVINYLTFDLIYFHINQIYI